MTDLLNAIIESGREVKAVHFCNGWIEFDTNEDYENAIEMAKEAANASGEGNSSQNGANKTAEIEKAAAGNN